MPAAAIFLLPVAVFLMPVTAVDACSSYILDGCDSYFLDACESCVLDACESYLLDGFVFLMLYHMGLDSPKDKNVHSLKGYLVYCLEHFFLLFFCLQIMFPQLFALFQILFLLLSCRNAVFLTSMPARG
jgi:hypothetical protein